MSKESIQERLKLIRKELGLTQQQMGEALGIMQSSYAQIEATGRSELTLRQLMILNEKFGVNPNYVLLGELPVFGHVGFVPAEDHKIRIPGVEGTIKMITLNDDSMYPTLMNTHIVIGNQRLDFKKVNNGKIHILVTNDGTTLVRYAQPMEDGLLTIPENIDRYTNKLIKYHDLSEVWEVQLRITGNIILPRGLFASSSHHLKPD